MAIEEGAGIVTGIATAAAGGQSAAPAACFPSYYATHQGADYLYRALPGSPNTIKWTLAFRIYIPAATDLDYSTFITFREGSTGYPNNECTVYTGSPESYIVFGIYGAGSEFIEVETPTQLARDQWHDVVIHYDSAHATESQRIRIWIDDAEEAITGDFPTQNLPAFSGAVVPDAHIFIAAIQPGASQYAMVGGFADMLFLSGVNWPPAACHDYVGNYGANDWHLKFETASVGSDSSGNGYTFTEVGDGLWLEPIADRCFDFTLPVLIDHWQPVSIGLPIHINRTASVATVSVPIHLGNLLVSTVSVPIHINRYTAVSTVSLPIHIYGDVETAAAADFIVWRPKVILDGTDISARLVGSGTVEFEEMASPVATFSFLPANGAVDPLAYVGTPVTVSWQKYVGGTLTNTMLMFTGVVSDPTWDADERVLSINATGDMQAYYDRMTKAQVDAQLAAHSPQFSQYVFGDPDDLSGWEYAEALASTCDATLWMDSAGRLRNTSFLAKSTADFTFTDADLIAGSLGDSPDYPNRQEMVNQIEITFGYRFVRRRQRQITVIFRDYADLETPSTYLSGNYGGWALPQRTQVESAANGGGWTVIGDITYEPVWPSGTYPTYSDSGVPMYIGWANDTRVTDEFCIGARWTAARRWKQTVTETATITVNATESQSVIGVLRDNESYSIEDNADDEEWEDSLEYTGYLSGATLMSNGIDRRSDLDELRDTFEAAQEVAILKAKHDILRAHRGTTVTCAAPYLPMLDLSHTVALDTTWLDCKGKVQRITHDWDLDSGGCTTTLDIALSRHSGAGLTEDTEIAPIEKADDPDETVPGTLLTFGIYIGGQDTQRPYAEIQDLSGYFVNVNDPYDLWSRDPANPQVTPRIYEEGFAVKYPDIDSSYADPSNAAATAAIEVAIPEDTLTITSG